MTALWEKQLNDISEGQGSYNGFMQPLNQELDSLVTAARVATMPAMTSNNPGGGKSTFRRRKKKTKKPA